MLIGFKDKIAFEFSLEVTNTPDRNYGHIILYLDNKAVGYYDDMINLDAFSYQFLRVIESRDVFFEEFAQIPYPDIFNKIIQSEEVIFDKCLLPLGESFDDFDVRFFKINEDVHFVWKLAENHFFEYKNQDYEVHGCSVKLRELQKLHKEFDNVLKK